MALASSLLTSTQPLEHAVLTSVHPGVQRSVVMRCGAEVPYIFHVASDNALLSCPRSSYTISSDAEMGVPLQSRVRASPARGHRAHADDDSVPGAGTVGRVGVPPEVKTPLGIYLQRHSPLSPELWLHYSRLSAR